MLNRPLGVEIHHLRLDTIRIGRETVERDKDPVDEGRDGRRVARFVDLQRGELAGLPGEHARVSPQLAERRRRLRASRIRDVHHVSGHLHPYVFVTVGGERDAPVSRDGVGLKQL